MALAHAGPIPWHWHMRVQFHGTDTCRSNSMALAHAGPIPWHWHMRVQFHGTGTCANISCNINKSDVALQMNSPIYQTKIDLCAKDLHSGHEMTFHGSSMDETNDN